MSVAGSVAEIWRYPVKSMRRPVRGRSRAPVGRTWGRARCDRHVSGREGGLQLRSGDPRPAVGADREAGAPRVAPGALGEAALPGRRTRPRPTFAASSPPGTASRSPILDVPDA